MALVLQAEAHITTSLYSISFLWQSLSHFHAFDSVEDLSKSPALDCYVVIKAHFRILKTGKLNPDESELFFPQFLANFLLISGNLSRFFLCCINGKTLESYLQCFRFFLKILRIREKAEKLST